jgi:short subunit dehydrogenase-like uncharacterized protein
MNDVSVVVYGASGYTGRLVCWKLAQRKIPFIAAGRNQTRLEDQLKKIPELAGARYTCAAVEHSVSALAKLFAGKKVVYNVAGPFMQLGSEVVQAALQAGCHYLDCTGEQDWMLEIREKYGAEFAKKKLLMVPATSMMWVSGLLAAEACLETPGIDSLDIVYAPKGSPTLASTLSFIRMCCQPQRYLEDNQLVSWPPATSYNVMVPGMHRTVNALPWSGGGEAVWFEHDPRVLNCTTLVSFTNQAAMAHTLHLMREFEEKYKKQPREKQEEATNKWGHAIMSGEPHREDLEIHRTIVACFGRGRTRGVSAILWGTCGYNQTGAIAAIAIERVLRGKIHATGFASPAAVFGARSLMREWAEEGLVEVEVRN